MYLRYNCYLLESLDQIVSLSYTATFDHSDLCQSSDIPSSSSERCIVRLTNGESCLNLYYQL